MNERNRSVRWIFVCGLAAMSLMTAASLFAAFSVEYDGVVYVVAQDRDQALIPPDLPEKHIVQPGDTLWDISTAYLQDPFLWPIIWDENLKTVPNPHLIFPGQEILFPARAVAPGAAPLAELEPLIPGGPMEPPSEIGVPGPAEEAAASIRYACNESELYTSGYITSHKEEGEHKIIGSNDPLGMFSEGDILYIDGGTDKGIRAGDKLLSFQNVKQVYHPVTNRYMGWMINYFSILKVICVQEHSATVVITQSWEPVQIGELVKDYHEMDNPIIAEHGKLGHCSLVPNPRILGYLCDVYGGAAGMGSGHILADAEVVYIDLGSRNGLLPGDVLYLSRENPNVAMPRIPCGALVIVRTMEETSTCLIISSQLEMYVGDRVESLF